MSKAKNSNIAPQPTKLESQGFLNLMSEPGGAMGLMSNPAKLQEVMSDPEVGPVLQKLITKLGPSLGGAAGGGGFGGGGAPPRGNEDDIPNLDDLPDPD